MKMLCLQKINYTTYIVKIKGLSVEDLCGEIRHFQKLGCESIFLAQSQKFMSVKLQWFCAFLSLRNFPILLLKHFFSVLFYENPLNLPQSKPRN